MNYQAVLDRILLAVDQAAYLTPSSHVPSHQKEAAAQIERAIQAPGFDPEAVRTLIRRMHEEGRIDRVMYLSSLSILAASPRVADYEEAVRMAAEQELAALELGGPNLDDNLASVDRHRGVVAYLKGHYDVALDYFSRALERQRTSENLGNVLCALVRLGELDEATSLYRQIRTNLPPGIVAELEQVVERDPDLALLRTEDR